MYLFFSQRTPFYPFLIVELSFCTAVFQVLGVDQLETIILSGKRRLGLWWRVVTFWVVFFGYSWRKGRGSQHPLGVGIFVIIAITGRLGGYGVHTVPVSWMGFKSVHVNES